MNEIPSTAIKWTTACLLLAGCGGVADPGRNPMSETFVENTNPSLYPDVSSFARASERQLMVDKQLVARGIRDNRVLDAMRRVPRHLFVPKAHQREAYEDHPVPIGLKQTISQPYIVAYMSEVLKLQPGDRVLEIGTGSGYQAAILGELAGEVYSMEILPELGKRASSVLEGLGYKDIQVRIGDGYKGWPEKAPFDAIIVTAAPPNVPQPLLEQLKVGGRMIIPVGTFRQGLMLIQRGEDGFDEENVLPVSFVPMTGEALESTAAKGNR